MQTYIQFLEKTAAICEDVGDNAYNHMPEYNEDVDMSLGGYKTDYMDAYKRQMDAQYVDDKAR